MILYMSFLLARYKIRLLRVTQPFDFSQNKRCASKSTGIPVRPDTFFNTPDFFSGSDQIPSEISDPHTISRLSNFNKFFVVQRYDFFNGGLQPKGYRGASVDKNSWESSPCYPQRTFDSLSENPSTFNEFLSNYHSITLQVKKIQEEVKY